MTLFDVLGGIATVVAFALINHFRGGAWGVPWFRDMAGRRLWWATPAVFFLAWPWMPEFYWHQYWLPAWGFAIAFALCYLVWGTPGWGRWYTMGHVPRDQSSGPPSRWEGWVERVAGDSDVLAFSIRNLIFLAPLYILFSTVLILMVPAITAIYEAAWAWRKDWSAIGIAEHLTGAAWGVALLIAGFALTV